MVKKIQVSGRITPNTKKTIYENGYNIGSALESFANQIPENGDIITYKKIIKDTLRRYNDSLKLSKHEKEKLIRSKNRIQQTYINITLQKQSIKQNNQNHKITQFESIINAADELLLVLKRNYKKREQMPQKQVDESILLSLAKKHNVKPGDILAEIDPKYYKCLQNYQKYVTKCQNKTIMLQKLEKQQGVNKL